MLVSIFFIILRSWIAVVHYIIGLYLGLPSHVGLIACTLLDWSVRFWHSHIETTGVHIDSFGVRAG